MYDYGYNYGYHAVSGIIGTVLLISFVVIAVLATFAILMIIGQWKCFKKAGYNGWEVLIGGHNQFVNCTFAGVNPILVLFVMFGSIVTIIPVIGWLAYVGFLIYYQIIVGVNTAKVFGKGTGFGIALAIPLSAPIAWFILGGKNVQYIGLKKDNSTNVASNDGVDNFSSPLNDRDVPIAQQQKQSEEVETILSEEISKTPAFCTNCGDPLMPNTKFCTNCGKQI